MGSNVVDLVWPKKNNYLDRFHGCSKVDIQGNTMIFIVVRLESSLVKFTGLLP